MDDDLDIICVDPTEDPAAARRIAALLASQDLEIDGGVEEFVTFQHYGRVLACAGLQGQVVKCVAIDPSLQGREVLLPLMTEMTYLALDHGVTHLFIYTKPEYREHFEACGYHHLATVPGTVTLLENTPRGLLACCEGLAHLRRLRDRVGSVVLNANPFTLGHRYLLQQAAHDCDVLHVFVVAEESRTFTFDERYRLVAAGVAELPERDHIMVHRGSPYLVSKATFPSYFLKDSGVVDRAGTGLDLTIFREHIAPSLGITHRYVGSEPFCPVTRAYNADMHRWLEDAPLAAPPVEVREIPRLERGGVPISASEVRRRFANKDLVALAGLVPAPTLALLTAKIQAATPTSTTPTSQTSTASTAGTASTPSLTPPTHADDPRPALVPAAVG
ncbi:[citrate (pro-3S)-lyase] ligase [Arsenicicoccus sp. oral taxon 190]|uniref:[citrate (pro-3S)-lyase] ligase n=1 Tax=Arsenicicoccus sp. oral taxon 190 TaxID=1658671 RepID=UPI00067C5BA0|nr:[citrate (pro-3S)-lyase] ligase [Arsenicicoccus sp. oral taxon 190]